MSRERFRRVEEICNSAIDLPHAERESFVASACAGDEGLRAEVLSLLGVMADDSTFLEGSIAAELVDPSEAPDQLLGERIGAYRVERVIGIGGMGAVYRARRDDGQFEMSVALKVMRPGTGGRDALRRFQQERQVLARLDHPGIARLVDGGMTADSRPYFAMELVEGEAIDAHCRGAGLEIADRLRLFVQAAEVVQAAHQALVIHRDLKPSNILVDASGRARVIDFGIALPMYLATAETMHTRAVDILGTLAYMSPEQCQRGAGASLDVRSDVYSLGVVLYELLTGRTPHDLADATIVEAIDRVTRGTPARPSSLEPRCRGDLETIVLKAIERDPGRRYGTVGELADDVRRYLANEPILARPASRAYAARKFVRRHRIGAGLSAAAILALLATTMAAIAQGRRAERARAAEHVQFGNAEWTAYVAAVGAAGAALQMHQPHIAHKWLESTPERLRGWEWDHLWYRLDQAQRELLDLGAPCLWMVVSRDGRLVAASSDDGVRVVRADSGAPVISFPTPRPPGRMDFLPDGRGLVWPDGGGKLALADLGDAAVRLVDCGGDVRRAACSPDGKWIVVGLGDGRVRVLEGESLQVAAELGNLGNSHIHQLAFSADGSVLAAAPWKGPHMGDVFVWSSGDWTSLGVVDGPESIVDGLALSDDGALLATGTIDQLVRVWSLPGGGPFGRPIRCEGLPLAMSFSPDSLALTIGCLGLVRTVDLSTGLEARTAHVHARSIPTMARLAGTREFVVALGSGRVVAFPETEEEVPLLGRPGDWVFDMAIATDGSRLLASRRWWDLRTGVELAVADMDDAGTVTISPDGAEVLIVSKGGMQIRDVVSDEPRVEVRAEAGQPWAGAWHPREPLIAIGGRSGCDIHLRDARTLEPLRAFDDTRRGQTRVLRFSPDGARLAAATLDGVGARVWDVETGRLIFSRPGRSSCWSVDWSSDGRILAAGAANEVILFDAEDWSEIGVLRGHEGVVKSLMFHPSGGPLATCSEDQSVRLWDVERRAQTLMLYGHHARCRALEWSRDGDLLATGDEAGAIRLWKRR